METITFMGIIFYSGILYTLGFILAFVGLYIFYALLLHFVFKFESFFGKAFVFTMLTIIGFMTFYHKTQIRAMQEKSFIVDIITTNCPHKDKAVVKSVIFKDLSLKNKIIQECYVQTHNEGIDILTKCGFSDKDIATLGDDEFEFINTVNFCKKQN